VLFTLFAFLNIEQSRLQLGPNKFAKWVFFVPVKIFSCFELNVVCNILVQVVHTYKIGSTRSLPTRFVFDSQKLTVVGQWINCSNIAYNCLMLCTNQCFKIINKISMNDIVWLACDKLFQQHLERCWLLNL
jgi:hypothetical protein